MREFTSFGAAALYMGGELVREIQRQGPAMERAAKVVEKEAKSVLGKYQPETPPFAAWAELADSTKTDRETKGFPENEPLLRTGEMRDSIDHRSDHESAVIGSDSEIAEYQELGTEHIPPRSFLGIGLMNKAEEVANILGRGVVGTLIGKEVFEGSIDLTSP